MVCEVCNVRRLNIEVFEGLRRWVDDLVVEFALNLISRHGVPPQETVQQASQRLENSLGHIDVATLLVDFPVNHDSNFCQAILFGSVKLKGLTRGRVIVKHLLESRANIDGLESLVACQITFEMSELT